MPNKSLKLCAVLFAAALLAGCEDMGHLYPLDAKGNMTTGEMPVHFTSFASGTGTINVIGPAGEVLRGSYGPPGNGYVFGDVFKTVFGQYSTNPATPDKGTPTIATLTGSKGDTMQCEFYNDDRTRNGFGGCKSVTGALYRLQY